MLLTIEKLKEQLSDNLLKSLKKDKGIYEFCFDREYSLGISFETGDPDISSEPEVYILNVFAGDQYLNISYVPGNQGLNDEVLTKVVQTWNKLQKDGFL